MYYKRVLGILFIIFGTYAIIFPGGISKNQITKSYTVIDLIRGWGIYCLAIGVLLFYPIYTKYILFGCFLFSIIWHILIVKRKGWTRHHKESIIINSIAIIILFMI